MAGEAIAAIVRRKLLVTYEDPDTDARIADIVENAEGELRYALGIHDGAFDFETPGEERSLLCNLCFYEFNGAADEFWQNYAPQVARCRDKWAVMQFAEGEEASPGV